MGPTVRRGTPEGQLSRRRLREGPLGPYVFQVPSDRPSALTSADPVRNFTLSVEERIRALTIGAPAWATRKRRIEDEIVRLVGELVALHHELTAEGRRASEVELAVTTAATALDLRKLNELVAKHNRYYPVEANLPMTASGDYLVYGKPWQPEEPVTAPRLLRLVRAELEPR